MATQRTGTATGSSVTDAQRRDFQQRLTYHIDGIGLISLIDSLDRHGVFSHIPDDPKLPVTLKQLLQATKSNGGYMNIAMRILGVHGIVKRTAMDNAEETKLAITPVGRYVIDALQKSHAANKVVNFTKDIRNLGALFFSDTPDASLGARLKEVVDASKRGWDIPSSSNPEFEAVRKRLILGLDGNVVGGIAIDLKDEHFFGFWGGFIKTNPWIWRYDGMKAWAMERRRGALWSNPEGSKITVDLAAVKGNLQYLQTAYDFLQHIGWATVSGTKVTLTDEGEYRAARAWSFGVPVSYFLLFRDFDKLIFGDAKALRVDVGAGEVETHVDRVLNVKGSGGAHLVYFKNVDDVIRSAFNKPFAEQPLGFADMGCGDGAWLSHIHGTIMNDTERGRLIKANPNDPKYKIKLVAADFSQEALDATSEKLNRMGIDHVTVIADINDPHRFRDDLAKKGINSKDLMHGSTFLIHNRPYVAPKDLATAGRRTTTPELAYADRGAIIPNKVLEQNLVEFFKRWSDIVGKHGMVVLDLHDAENPEIGKTLTNYFVTHGFSDQYTMPLRIFVEAAKEAGFKADPKIQKRFPDVEHLATVSVNYFTN